jgi:hypothetical protein
LELQGLICPRCSFAAVVLEVFWPWNAAAAVVFVVELIFGYLCR